MVDLEPHDLIVATLSPLKESDLVDRARELIGKRCSFIVGWVIETGTYAGHWAMIPAWPCSAGWFPDCDLTDIERVPREAFCG